MTKLEALNIVYRALRFSTISEIDDVTFDNDNDSGEVILTTVDFLERKQTWVISSKDIRETDDEAQD